MRATDILANEILAKEKCLGDPFGLFLDGVGKLKSQLRAVAKELLEAGKVGGSRNDEDFPEFPPSSGRRAGNRSSVCRRPAGAACRC